MSYENQALNLDQALKIINRLETDLALAREENKTLIDQHQIMRMSYNSLCDDLNNGEHVEMDWIRQAIDSAARDILVGVLNSKIARLKKDLALAREGLRVSANQLEGVSIAIKAHGQNINVSFFIETYLEMATDKREILAQLDKKDVEK